MLFLGKHLGVALTVKKNVYGFTLAFALLFSAAAGLMLVVPVEANFTVVNYCPSIVITSEGFVSPDMQSIQRDGNNYFLTEDIKGYSLRVERSNIVLDGQGHLLNCTPYTNHPILAYDVTNVTVKNFQIQGVTGILIGRSSHCTIDGIKIDHYKVALTESNFNTVTNCNAGISIVASNSNTITKNNLTNVVIFGGHSDTASNAFYLNNVFDGYSLINDIAFWDNGSVGNYWVGYNGTDADGDGIGDTPYVLDADNVDYHPLMCPYDIENDAIAFPTPEPQPEPFPTTLVIATALSGAFVFIGLIIYFKLRFLALLVLLLLSRFQ
jgi:hypothetical protein